MVKPQRATIDLDVSVSNPTLASKFRTALILHFLVLVAVEFIDGALAWVHRWLIQHTSKHRTHGALQRFRCMAFHAPG